MRALSERQAASCEYATSPASSCKCRCGGAFHGSRRAVPTELPPDDPHHAELRPEDLQTSLLEALEYSDVLERLGRARKPEPEELLR